MVAQGGFDQSDMNTSDMQKTAFDSVDMRTPISEPVIAELLRDFAIAVGKQRLVDAADKVAESLVDLGIETYGDLRSATYQMYVDHCGVKPIDAGRLVAHFAPPEKVENVAVAPRGVTQGVRAKMRFVATNRVVGPDQGHENDADHVDMHNDEYLQRSEDSGAVGGEERSASQPPGTPALQGTNPGPEAADNINMGDVAGTEDQVYTDVVLWTRRSV